jgi:hypothetical protein
MRPEKRTTIQRTRLTLTTFDFQLDSEGFGKVFELFQRTLAPYLKVEDRTDDRKLWGIQRTATSKT